MLILYKKSCPSSSDTVESAIHTQIRDKEYLILLRGIRLKAIYIIAYDNALS